MNEAMQYKILEYLVENNFKKISKLILFEIPYQLKKLKPFFLKNK